MSCKINPIIINANPVRARKRTILLCLSIYFCAASLVSLERLSVDNTKYSGSFVSLGKPYLNNNTTPKMSKSKPTEENQLISHIVYKVH